MISIISCWRDHAELIPDYEAAVQGAQAIVINDDHGDTDWEQSTQVFDMVDRLGGKAETMPNRPFSFAAACNAGLKHATGDIILCLNNDITATPGWLAAVERDVMGDGLYGPETHLKMVHGRPLLYVDGWCVAARRAVWEELGGFDAETFQRPYWEDVDLSWRAVQAGYTLHQTRWQVQHLGNTTSRTVAGAYDASAANQAAFEAKVAAAVLV